MRVTIDVDEGTWKELTEYVLKKHRKLYGKYRRNTVNDVLKLGLKALKRSNAGEFKKLIETAEVSESFLESSLEMSKEIRQRSAARVEMT
jgi:SPX domain protein involved in polyphosphate accumulation